MNTAIFGAFRGIAILFLLAIGVVTTIATGGGGGGDGGMSGGGAPPTNSEPSFAITPESAELISSSVVVAIGVSFDLGEISGDNLVSQAAGDMLNLSGVQNLGSLNMKFGNPVAQAIEGCEVSGTVDVTMTITDPDSPTVGDRIIAVFDNCDNNLGYVISGTIDLTISALQGDLHTDVFLVGFDIILADVLVAEDGETIEANGAFTLTLDSLDFPVRTMSLVGDELRFTAREYMVPLMNFDHSLTNDIGVVPDTKLAEAFGRLDFGNMVGSVDYSTPVPIQAIGDLDPHAGVILVTGSGGSTVRINIFDETRITLEVDTNGDGVIDEYIETSWGELSQQTSTTDEISQVSSSTAPIIAREVFNAVTGFGSVTVAGGRQFQPDEVFGLLKQQSISGNFGPMTIDCLAEGSADVSGSLATAGTFSTNDQLNANFAGCTAGYAVLDGQMELTVNSFAEATDYSYLLTATVTETEFRRFAGGSCFTGWGTFDTSYDQNGLSFNSASSANAFSIHAGGRKQELRDAVVSAQVSLDEVTRTSSGRVTSADLVGSFGYQSISPDRFVVDENPVTGPYSGELLITADDGSSMRMVALDELVLRLDMDFDGDSIIDDNMLMNWIDLTYGNAYGMCEL